VQWDGETDLRLLEDDELREIATDAARRAKRLFARPTKRQWWSEVQFAAEWALAVRQLAARPSESGPTSVQARLLAALAAHPLKEAQKSALAEVTKDLDRTTASAAMHDAIERGWVISYVGGIGGTHSEPEGHYELTAAGQRQLVDS
jgi:hypothetical protein